MSKQSSTYKIAERIANNIIASQVHARLQMSADAACIAANKVFHMGAKRAPEFCEAYKDALHELAGLYLDDADNNHDNRIDYAKGKRDEIMKKFMGDAFSEFDKAYGAVYFDEGMRIRGAK